MLLKTLFGGCLLAIQLCGITLFAAGEPGVHSIVSPRLDVLQNRRLSIDLPSYLLIAIHPSQEDWLTIESDVACSVKPPRGGIHGIVIQIIRWPISRAERKGALTGKPFTTRSGLAGIRIDDAMQGSGKVDCSSSLTMVNQSNDAVIFIKVSADGHPRVDSEECRALHDISTDVFSNARIQ